MRLGCVVMACGAGRRFRRAGGAGSKLLADLAGAPLIVRTVSSVPGDAYEVVVSLRGGGLARAVAFAAPAACLVVHEGPPPPRSRALRDGLAAGAEVWDGCLFLPGDQPLVGTASFRALAAAFARDPSRAYRLSWQGRPGSPVLFPRSCFGALMALEGSQGGGVLLRDGSVLVACVEAERAEELLDVDVPDDLARAAELLRGC